MIHLTNKCHHPSPPSLPLPPSPPSPHCLCRLAAHRRRCRNAAAMRFAAGAATSVGDGVTRSAYVTDETDWRRQRWSQLSACLITVVPAAAIAPPPPLTSFQNFLNTNVANPSCMLSASCHPKPSGGPVFGPAPKPPSRRCGVGRPPAPAGALSLLALNPAVVRPPAPAPAPEAVCGV